MARQAQTRDKLMAAKAKKEAEAEAEAEEDAEGEAAQPKRKLPLKLIVIAAAALLVIGGATATFFIFTGRNHKEQRAAPSAKPVAFYELPDVMVNLASSGNDRTQYLKIKVVLELPDQTMVAQIQPLLPRVVDAFQTYLRELRITDLEGSAGLFRLRDELGRRVNVAVAPARVNAVLFKEIVVQ
jgi:flagellar FliL protein